jgi:hypothetical protein
MLGKLMKHEFRATGQVMLPLLAFLLISAVGVNISERIMEHTDSNAARFVGGALIILFVLAIIILTVMSVVLMAQRFYKNLLTDEGYLMFTLPVSVHGILWSKIFVSAIWFIVVGLADMLCALIATFKVSMVNSFINGFKDLFSGITAQYALNGTAFVLEGLLIVLLACAGLCLLFYASMSVGFSFASHKWLLTVVFFFAFQIVMQIFGMGGLFTWVSTVGPASTASIFAQMHSSMWVVIASEAAFCAIFYVVTALMLKKHLNLE